MVTALSFLIILSLLILVHEGGHFLMAKKAGIKVEEFGFGLPPRIFGKRIGETIYSINLFPLGGFVRLYGEEGIVKEDRSRSFSAKSKATKIGILLAGVMMNLLLAIVLFCFVYSFLGIPEKGEKITILSVMSNSPAIQAGLEEKDIIASVDGQAVKEIDQFITFIKEKTGQLVVLEIERGGDSSQLEKFSVELKPREHPPEGEGAIGVVISDTQIKHYPFYQIIPKAIYNGVLEALFWMKEMVIVLKSILVSIWHGGGLPQGVAGPVGIYQATDQVSKQGVWALIHFTGILSINLAVFNLIPFPALDGGRIVFVFLENFLGKKKRQRVERWINTAGMVFLLLFLFLITINDIKRFVK